jgi:hypothetical protein
LLEQIKAAKVTLDYDGLYSNPDYTGEMFVEARRRAVERHIHTCACCATMAACLRRTVAACRAEGKRRLPRAVMSRMEKRIRALVTRERRVAAHTG